MNWSPIWRFYRYDARFSSHPCQSDGLLLPAISVPVMFQGLGVIVKYAHDDLSFQIPSHSAYVVNITFHLTLCPTGSLYLILERKKRPAKCTKRIVGSEFLTALSVRIPFVACHAVCFGMKVSTFRINVYLVLRVETCADRGQIVSDIGNWGDFDPQKGQFWR